MHHKSHKGCGCVTSFLSFIEYKANDIATCPTPANDNDPLGLLEQKVYYVADKIYTLDDSTAETEVAKAVAVQGETIQEVYTEAQWNEFLKSDEYSSAKDDDRVHVLEGYLYPGFYECHMHPLLDGLLFMSGTNLRSAEDVPQLVSALNNLLEELDPKGKDTLVIGYNVNPLSQIVPTTHTWRAVLDTVGVEDSEPQPSNLYVVVEHNSMHIWYVNSHLLNAIFDLNPGLKDSEGVETYFPKKNGEFTGVVQEDEGIAYLLTTIALLGLAPDDPSILNEAAQCIAKQAQAVGCTTITDAMAGSLHGDLETYLNVTSKNSLEEFPVRLVVHPYFDSPFALKTMALTDEFTKDPNVNRRLSVGAIKYVVDGSLQGGTAYNPPYREEGFKKYFNGDIEGVLNLTQDELEWRLRVYKNQGRQPMIHANSTGAIQIALDALKAVYPTPEEMRHAAPRIEHCQIATEKQLAFMAEWGVKANILVNHVFYWGEIYYNELLPPVVAEGISPVKTGIDLGLEVALHSDAYVSPLSPLRLIWTAVTRHSQKLGNVSGNCLYEPGTTPENGLEYDTNKCGILSPGERVSRMEALKGVTVHAAHMDKDYTKGVIKKGMTADFTHLGQDLFAVETEQIMNIPVNGTIVGGHYLEVPAESAPVQTEAAV